MQQLETNYASTYVGIVSRNTINKKKLAQLKFEIPGTCMSFILQYHEYKTGYNKER